MIVQYIQAETKNSLVVTVGETALGTPEWNSSREEKERNPEEQARLI